MTDGSGKIILGIDPGSVSLGVGFILTGTNLAYVTHETIKVKGDSLPLKLLYIYEAISEVIEKHQPDEVAIETVFMAKNAQSALKLGQARGAAICAAAKAGLPVSEYAPRLIKQTAVGHGGADKKQVQKMMQMLFALAEPPQSDAADALAIAVCHANHRNLANNTKLPITATRKRRSKRPTRI